MEVILLELVLGYEGVFPLDMDARLDEGLVLGVGVVRGQQQAVLVREEDVLDVGVRLLSLLDQLD